MRVVFMPAPAIGHAFPMVPLAWALRTAGHEVLFVVGGDGVAVADAGMPVIDPLPGRTTTELFMEFVRDQPDVMKPLDGEPIAAMNERKGAVLAAWDPFVDSHVEHALRLRPDLVVYDPVFGVGPIVSAKLGIPAVALGSYLVRFPPELLAEPESAAGFERWGVEVPEGIPTIDQAPPSLVEGPPSNLAIRYIPYNGGQALPEWLTTPPERRRVAVTFGSLERAHQGPVEAVIAAAGDVDAEFVVASGEVESGSVALPPNVRRIGWVPLHALLPTCVAAIHHSGSGSALTSCSLGVPQLVMPGGNPGPSAEAALLSARGAALVVEADDLDAAVLDRLLTDEDLRRVAGELRDEIAALPPPSEVVPKLVDLVAGRSPVLTSV